MVKIVIRNCKQEIIFEGEGKKLQQSIDLVCNMIDETTERNDLEVGSSTGIFGNEVFMNFALYSSCGFPQYHVGLNATISWVRKGGDEN